MPARLGTWQAWDICEVSTAVASRNKSNPLHTKTAQTEPCFERASSILATRVRRRNESRGTYRLQPTSYHVASSPGSWWKCLVSAPVIIQRRSITQRHDININCVPKSSFSYPQAKLPAQEVFAGIYVLKLPPRRTQQHRRLLSPDTGSVFIAHLGVGSKYFKMQVLALLALVGAALSAPPRQTAEGQEDVSLYAGQLVFDHKLDTFIVGIGFTLGPSVTYCGASNFSIPSTTHKCDDTDYSFSIGRVAGYCCRYSVHLSHATKSG